MGIQFRFQLFDGFAQNRLADIELPGSGTVITGFSNGCKINQLLDIQDADLPCKVPLLYHAMACGRNGKKRMKNSYRGYE